MLQRNPNFQGQTGIRTRSQGRRSKNPEQFSGLDHQVRPKYHLHLLHHCQGLLFELFLLIRNELPYTLYSLRKGEPE